jgi:hypothetical protein
MEIGAQDQPFAIARHRHGRTLAGQRLSHETAAKLLDKTVERTGCWWLTCAMYRAVLGTPQAWPTTALRICQLWAGERADDIEDFG